jgi:uncharacterized membrane protein YbhN (UPF0104 family)
VLAGPDLLVARGAETSSAARPAERIEAKTPPFARRHRGRRAAAVLVAVALAGATFLLVLPRIAAYSSVGSTLSGLTWPWIAALVAATLVNIMTFAPPWMVLLPRLGLMRAVSLTQASTAFSSIIPGGAPVGMAASFTMLRSWGFEGRPVGLAVSLTGVWNQLSVFAFPVIAAAFLATEGGGSRSLAVLAAVGVAMFAAIVALVALVLLHPRLAFRTGEFASRLAGRFNRLRGRAAPTWDGTVWGRFRVETLELLRHRWVALTVATVVNQMTGYLMFELSVRAVGISVAQVSVAESFAAWSIGRLLISLPLTPGGIGVVELGLTGSLIAFGGPNDKVVAGVLLYRALSILPTVLAGAIALATWRWQRPHAPLASDR